MNERHGQHEQGAQLGAAVVAAALMALAGAVLWLAGASRLVDGFRCSDRQILDAVGRL